jgi:hypothetical protein
MIGFSNRSLRRAVLTLARVAATTSVSGSAWVCKADVPDRREFERCRPPCFGESGHLLQRDRTIGSAASRG